MSFAARGITVVKLQQRAWVNANHTVNDEFQSTPDLRLHSAGEAKSNACRVAGIHHDLQVALA